MKFSAVVLALASVAAAAPSLVARGPTSVLQVLARRETVDYAALVAPQCKETCAALNGLFVAWDAQECNKSVTDGCNKLACSYLDRQLECGECQLRAGGADLVTSADVDKENEQARAECASLGFPTN